jgi:valyl-tRNA synthetase
MSKSLGNIINPMEVVNLYGADAFRMGLVIGNTPGTDLALDEAKIAGYRNFANKLWNIGRFILMKADPSVFGEPLSPPKAITPADASILKEEERIVGDVTRLMEEFRFYRAGEMLYHYAWHTLADKYLEASKPQLDDPRARENTSRILRWLLERLLIMLHPFMPFVTETIWQHLPHRTQTPLIVQHWPR